LPEPGPAAVGRPVRCRSRAARRRPGGRRPDPPRARRTPALGGDDRQVAAPAGRRGRRRARAILRRRFHPRAPLGNAPLAIGQIIVSIGLIAAILLQARGTGLSGTFGGDSAVYRSRRGIERRLWQFTILLLILFVAFSVGSYLFQNI